MGEEVVTFFSSGTHFDTSRDSPRGEDAETAFPADLKSHIHHRQHLVREYSPSVTDIQRRGRIGAAEPSTFGTFRASRVCLSRLSRGRSFHTRRILKRSSDEMVVLFLKGRIKRLPRHRHPHPSTAVAGGEACLWNKIGNSSPCVCALLSCRLSAVAWGKSKKKKCVSNMARTAMQAGVHVWEKKGRTARPR